MKKSLRFKFLTLIYVLMIIVIATTAFTLSWYANNAIATAQNATLVSAMDTQATATWESITDTDYSGETGNAYVTEPDALYSAEIQISINISASAGTSKLKIDLTHLIITRHELSEEDKYLVTTSDVDQNFTIRITLPSDPTKVYKRNSEGVFVLESENGVFVPSGSPEVLLPLENGDNTLNMSIIFLRESHYCIWQEDNIRALEDYTEYLADGGDPDVSIESWIPMQKNSDHTPKYFNYNDFTYSHPQYMHTNFHIAFIYTVIEE